MKNFEVFNENDFLETRNDLSDSEISYSLKKIRKRECNKKRLKLTSKYGNDGERQLKKQRPLKKFPPRNLTIFYAISLP